MSDRVLDLSLQVAQLKNRSDAADGVIDALNTALAEERRKREAVETASGCGERSGKG